MSFIAAGTCQSSHAARLICMTEEAKMSKRMSIAAVIASFLAVSAFGQVPAPKRESRLHHLFASHKDADNLQERFNDLKCALVLIEAGPRLGTGFYISSDGDVATASHV